MSAFYVPDKFKPACQFCKYSLGVPVWIAAAITNKLLSNFEERILGDEVPLDILATGGSIPQDLGNIKKLGELLDEMSNFGKKTF
jgi:hypothetical protein